MTPCDWGECQGEQADSKLASDSSWAPFVCRDLALIQRCPKIPRHWPACPQSPSLLGALSHVLMHLSLMRAYEGVSLGLKSVFSALEMND